MNQNTTIESSFSSIGEDISQSTPIKSYTSSFNEPINLENGNFNAYSTPELENRYIPSYLCEKKPSTFTYTPVSLIKKTTPKVNFHNIMDLISTATPSTSDYGSLCSSGYASNDNVTPKMTLLYDNKENSEPSKAPKDSKVRTTFSDYQKQELEINFQKNPYPDPRDLEDLSISLGLGEAVIKVWFQNKRSRDKQRKFSHANRSAMRTMGVLNGKNVENKVQNDASPIMSNIQMLTNKINNYQNVMMAMQGQNLFNNMQAYY